MQNIYVFKKPIYPMHLYFSLSFLFMKLYLELTGFRITFRNTQSTLYSCVHLFNMLYKPIFPKISQQSELDMDFFPSFCNSTDIRIKKKKLKQNEV